MAILLRWNGTSMPVSPLRWRQGCAMPIRPYLQGQAFDPESIGVMSAAFENACRQLGILDRHDALSKIIARTVIDMAQRGFRDEESLTDAVMQEFAPPTR
jgi:hypothetical protein